MLQTIREKTQGWIAAVLLGMIAIPFALWGINSYFESGGNVTVATVGDVKIDLNEYRGALEQQRQALAQMLGKNFDPKLFDSPAFKRQVLNGVIDRTLVNLEADKAGYRVGDAQLSAMIQAIPEFQQDNRFNVQRYQQVVAQAGMSVPQFENRMRDQGVAQQVRDGYSESAFQTNSEIERVAALQAQQRRVAYVVLPVERFLADAHPSANRIEAYYKTHADEFKIPEQVRVQYIELSVDEIAKTISPSEADLRKAYQDDADRYAVPEERKASHILIAVPSTATPAQQKQALAKAEELRAKLQKGADFAALAREYSADKGSAVHGGDLGFVRRGVMVKEFDAALFGLKPGQISAPVKTQYGYHLIKLTAVKPGSKKTFEQVKGDLRDKVRHRMAEDRFYDLSDKFGDLIYEHPDSLAQAAEVLKIPVKESDWFSRAGGPGIASNPKVVEAAFSPDVLAQGNNSAAVELGDGALAAVRVVSHKDASVKPLTAVRAEVEGALKRQQALEAASKAADTLLAQANQMGDLAKAAAKQGANPLRDLTLSRDKPDPKVDPAISAAVFKASRPEKGKPVFGSVDLNGRGYAVFALESVSAPAAAELAQAKEQARQSLQRRDTTDLDAAYLAELRREIPIKVYEDKL